MKSERPQNKHLVPGRKPGARDKSKRLQEAIIEAGGDAAKADPMEYLASVLRDESNPKDIRVQVANMLLPYYHSKKPTLNQNQNDTKMTVNAVDKPTAARMMAVFLEEYGHQHTG